MNITKQDICLGIMNYINKKNLIIILLFTLSSCSVFLRKTEFSNELSNIYVERKELLDNENQKILVNLSKDNYAALSIGPALIPIIPMSLPPLLIPCRFEVSIKIYKNEKSDIKRISSIKAYNQNGDVLIPDNFYGKYAYESIKNYRYGSTTDTLIYNSLSRIYESKEQSKLNEYEQSNGNQRYKCSFKTYKKLKELTLEIKYLNIEGKEVVIYPFKYYVDSKLEYRPLICGK